MKKILFTGGGTGGHIFPIISIAREIRRMCPGEDPQLSFIGPKDEFGSIFLSQEGIKVKAVLAGKIRRYFSPKSIFQNFIDLVFKIPLGILEAVFYIFFSAPDLVFSRGGFGSVPGAFAGWLLGVPIILHESDIAPSLANRFLSRLATEIFVSFSRNETEYFPLKHTTSIGNPIRREILRGTKEGAKKIFHLTYEKPVILILGGSQGAQRINNTFLENLPAILNNFELIHQCGEKNFKQVKAEAEVILNEKLRKYYHPVSFLREIELAQAYAAADIIVSRAGSSSIFEIAAIGKPSILIPLPEAAQNHQVKNAYAYAQRGACLVMEENNFTSRFFLERTKNLFADKEAIKRMVKGTKEFARPKAAKVIANYVIEFVMR